ncbi:MAG TPA: hypothetical protein VKV17_18415 [Bryobacteraceae bacterium]|nr:hypothetical protein [Bryobacteraceae bacterium]
MIAPGPVPVTGQFLRQTGLAAAPIRTNPSPAFRAPGHATVSPVQRKAGVAFRPLVSARTGSTVQLARWSFGAKQSEMTNSEWFKSGMSTFGSILYEDEEGELLSLETVKNVTTKKYGKEHAEDVAIRSLLENFSKEELDGLPVVLTLSKSPCSSKYGTSNKPKGCAEELVDFVREYGVKLTIICRGLYKGLGASRQALEWMESEGITVSGDVRLGREQRYGY